MLPKCNNRYLKFETDKKQNRPVASAFVVIEEAKGKKNKLKDNVEELTLFEVWKELVVIVLEHK